MTPLERYLRYKKKNCIIAVSYLNIYGRLWHLYVNIQQFYQRVSRSSPDKSRVHGRLVLLNLEARPEFNTMSRRSDATDGLELGTALLRLYTKAHRGVVSWMWRMWSSLAHFLDQGYPSLSAHYVDLLATRDNNSPISRLLASIPGTTILKQYK